MMKAQLPTLSKISQVLVVVYYHYTITVAALVILLHSGAFKTSYDHHSSESLVLGRREQLAGKCTIPYESAHAALSSNVPSAVASTVTLAIVLA